MGQTIESEYGREPITVDARVPVFSVNWLLDRTNVGASRVDVAEEFRGRMDRSPDDFPADVADDVIRYALWKHAENLASYQWVMGSH